MIAVSRVNKDGTVCELCRVQSDDKAGAASIAQAMSKIHWQNFYVQAWDMDGTWNATYLDGWSVSAKDAPNHI